MPYIDKAYYDDTFKGLPIADQLTFERLAARASDLIDQITRYVLYGVDFTSFAQLIQDNVKKATAAQIEYMVSLGGELTIHGSGGVSDVKVGNFNYSQDNSNKTIVSPAVMEYLKPTGLLYRGVNVSDSSYSVATFNP